MMKIFTGLFFILHGLVHLVYFAQSARFFTLREGFKWPNGSWAFSIIFKNKAIRNLAGFFCLLSALCFIAGGIALFANHSNWYYLIVGSAVFSTFIFVLFWDGVIDKLGCKGIFGILINITIIVMLVYLHWPVIY
jgi:hypothetical protein